MGTFTLVPKVQRRYLGWLYWGTVYKNMAHRARHDIYFLLRSTYHIMMYLKHFVINSAAVLSSQHTQLERGNKMWASAVASITERHKFLSSQMSHTNFV